MGELFTASALKPTLAAYGLSLRTPQAANANQSPALAPDGGAVAAAASAPTDMTPPPADAGMGATPAGDASTTPVAANGATLTAIAG
jgi:hypothetical protein